MESATVLETEDILSAEELAAIWEELEQADLLFTAIACNTVDF